MIFTFLKCFKSMLALAPPPTSISLGRLLPGTRALGLVKDGQVSLGPVPENSTLSNQNWLLQTKGEKLLVTSVEKAALCLSACCLPKPTGGPRKKSQQKGCSEDWMEKSWKGRFFPGPPILYLGGRKEGGRFSVLQKEGTALHKAKVRGCLSSLGGPLEDANPSGTEVGVLKNTSSRIGLPTYKDSRQHYHLEDLDFDQGL
ncbi:uncharacterized protein LOC119941206 isoform X2 [Tachyglossus aculeatus]|uniref:uncharacterized protein LOC119941206 isoform X2 n=1 Tax=Tachyglossus aculeatus TaxID=9261 RepID=UPI0018F71C6A|nr:uncharacterized protein LOC119941206 isoform X2 [Tachyglossus aculeatus]